MAQVSARSVPVESLDKIGRLRQENLCQIKYADNNLDFHNGNRWSAVATPNRSEVTFFYSKETGVTIIAILINSHEQNPN